jgi:hypothetical protein
MISLRYHAAKSVSRQMVAGAAAIVLAADAAFAQDIPEFNKLRTPQSPAFVILGISPAEIERPTSPRPFAVSLLQRAREAADLPRSYAAEFAPYWMARHPYLTFSSDTGRTWRSAYREASISLATTDSLGNGQGPSVTDTTFRRLGFGVRTTLVRGKLPEKTKRCVGRVSTAATKAATILGRLFVQHTPAPQTAVEAERVRAQLWPEALDSLSPEEREALEETAKDCTERLAAREHFALDFASAAALDFAGGAASQGQVSSAGVWLTPGWLGESFSNIGIVRVLWTQLNTDDHSVALDLGARSIYAWQGFASSVEAVVRRVSEDDETKSRVRLSAIFDAKLTQETWFTMTLGKDFDPKAKSSFLAILGLKWQLGDRTLKPDNAK